MKQSNRAVVFVHIPKTGGTTLTSVIIRQYPPSAVLNLPGEHSLAAVGQTPIAAKAPIRCVIGHFPYGVHRYLSAPVDYITLLRDPIDRIISFYYYILRSPQHHMYRAVTCKRMSLDTFIRETEAEELSDLQVRLLAGIGAETNRSRSPVSSDPLKVAQDNLSRHFLAFGLTKRFDESLILFKRRLGWSDVYYQKKNVTPGRPPKEEIPKETLKQIEQRNELDMRLYEFAESRFQQLVEEQGASFQAEVQSFRRSNSALPRPLMRLRDLWASQSLRLYWAFRTRAQGFKPAGIALRK